MVVEDASIHVHRKGIMRTNVGQLDRTEGTLKDPAKKRALKEMPHPIETLPLNIETEMPEKGPPGGLLARQVEPQKWVSPDDHQLYINSKYRPYHQRKVHGERQGGLLQIKTGGAKIKPVSEVERRGLVWGSR